MPRRKDKKKENENALKKRRYEETAQLHAFDPRIFTGPHLGSI